MLVSSSFVNWCSNEKAATRLMSGTVEADDGQPRARPLTSDERSGPHASRATGLSCSYALKMLVCVCTARFKLLICFLADRFAGAALPK